MMAASPHLPAIRSERRIALINPAAAAQDQAALAMKLLDSVLWVFRGTTQSNWTVGSAEAAQVVFVHQDEPAGHITQWRNEGKLIVVIKTNAPASAPSPYTLTYPFQAVQVLGILERLDTELDSRATTGPAGAPGNNSFASHDDADGSDAWSFVDALRTLRLINNAEAWFVGRSSSGSVLWVRGDGRRYCCDSETAGAIRMGARKLSGLTLQKAAAPPAGLPAGSGSELAWFAGYHASTALAPWLSESKKYRLTRWPDLGRVQPDDPVRRAAQIRVLATLDAAPATVAELCLSIDTSPEIVVRTLNALASCELVAVAPSAVPDEAKTKPVSPAGASRLRQFLQNMRKHLGLWTSA